MYILTIAYGNPADSAAFDSYYADTHLEIAGKIPHVQTFAYGKCESLAGQEPSAYSQAVLTFADRASADDALGSTEGRAAAEDFTNFASGGVTLTLTQVEIATS